MPYTLSKTQTMKKIWLQHYPADVPAEIELGKYQSLPELLAQSVNRFGKQPAFISMGRTMSYEELDLRSHYFASWLQQGSGLQQGDRVAIMLPNCLQYPIALFGLLRAGLVVVNVNPQYTPSELKHQLQDSGARAIVVMTNFAHTLAQIIGETAVRKVIITEVGDELPWLKGKAVNFAVRYLKKMVKEWHLDDTITWISCLREGQHYSFQPVELAPEELAFLQYTGGTTGVAKGAMLTHRNLIANIQQIKASYGSLITEGAEIMVTVLPLYHIFALTVNCLFMIQQGGCNILITNPFDIIGIAKALKQQPFTIITGVNTLFSHFLACAEFCKLDFSTLKLSVGGGMAVSAEIASRWKSMTGSHLLEGYGLTECSPLVTVSPHDKKEFNGSIGVPVSSTSIKLIGLSGEDVPDGEPGELCVSGPQVMQGYWQQPAASDEVIDENGWLHTGDIVKMDKKGFLYLVDRKKDMILVSGFNVYPAEVEKVLLTHPAVKEVAVISVPSEKSGEALKVFVVVTEEVTEDALIQHCRTSLTGYKVPRLFEFLDALPKTSVGKVLKRALKDSIQIG